MGGGAAADTGGGKDVAEYLLAGGGAAVVSRTFIAPIERVKIMYQTTKGSQQAGWLSIAPRVWREEGLLAFWKGNTVAVVRCVPYLSVQLACNDLFRHGIDQVSGDLYALPPAVRNLAAGTLAGATAVSTTYPLDTVRARLAVQVAADGPAQGMLPMMRRIASEEGAAALYRGCWMSCLGGGVYAGLKFMTYDATKAQFHRLVGVQSDRELKVWQRAFSGIVGGVVAQTVAYPIDIMRRRMQTAKGESPYRGVVHGAITIAREEGITTGLYRGLTLNYLKTMPNVAIYLSLYDVFKYWLLDFRRA